MTTIIKNAQLINEGKIFHSDLLIKGGRIERIDKGFDVPYRVQEINGDHLYLMPGVIDDQVHFREPGLTHKADIHSESRAAVAGGVTSYMEMPNTNPATLTPTLLEQKYEIARRQSLANYSFYMGVSNDNFDEVMKVVKSQEQLDIKTICGLKIFMGSSTGNLLVDDPSVLERIFAESSMLIATHCEDEATTRQNLQHYREKYGDKLDVSFHPLIRNEEACYRSSSFAIDLAKKHLTRLHILHISTAKEVQLFDATTPLQQKRITSEACVHHLWFTADDYPRLGNQIKCNPAIKSATHRPAILAGVLNNHIDIIATDHAPHTAEEKAKNYLEAPAGLPLVQHPLHIMLALYHRGEITLEKVIEKMCHAPADCFRLMDRGYLREGYHADLVLFDTTTPYIVTAANLLYKCGWSPLEGTTFRSTIHATYVNGNEVYKNGAIQELEMGSRLAFY